MKYFSAIVIVVFFAIAVSSNLAAQDQPPMRGPGAERIEQFKKVRLIEVMNMDEETSIRFFTRYNKHTETLRALQRDHNALIDDLQKLSKSNAKNAEIELLIKDIGMSEEKITETRAKFLEDLKDVISIKQVAQYVVFERNFNKNLREIMRDIAKERWDRQR